MEAEPTKEPEDTAEEIAGSSEAPVFTTGEIDAYRASFLNTVRTKSRKSLHIDADLHRRISSLVWAVGRGEVTVAGFVNQVLAHHFEENGGLINAVLEKYYQSLKSKGHGIPFYYPVHLCLLPEH